MWNYCRTLTVHRVKGSYMGEDTTRATDVPRFSDLERLYKKLVDTASPLYSKDQLIASLCRLESDLRKNESHLIGYGLPKYPATCGLIFDSSIVNLYYIKIPVSKSVWHAPFKPGDFGKLLLKHLPAKQRQLFKDKKLSPDEIMALKDQKKYPRKYKDLISSGRVTCAEAALFHVRLDDLSQALQRYNERRLSETYIYRWTKDLGEPRVKDGHTRYYIQVGTKTDEVGDPEPIMDDEYVQAPYISKFHKQTDEALRSDWRPRLQCLKVKLIAAAKDIISSRKNTDITTIAIRQLQETFSVSDCTFLLKLERSYDQLPSEMLRKAGDYGGFVQFMLFLGELEAERQFRMITGARMMLSRFYDHEGPKDEYYGIAPTSLGQRARREFEDAAMFYKTASSDQKNWFNNYKTKLGELMENKFRYKLTMDFMVSDKTYMRMMEPLLKRYVNCMDYQLQKEGKIRHDFQKLGVGTPANENNLAQQRNKIEFKDDNTVVFNGTPYYLNDQQYFILGLLRANGGKQGKELHVGQVRDQVAKKFAVRGDWRIGNVFKKSKVWGTVIVKTEWAKYRLNY